MVQVAVSLLLVTLASSWVLARPQDSDEVNTSKIRIIVPDEHDDENGRAFDTDKDLQVGNVQDNVGVTNYNIIPSLPTFISSSSADGSYHSSTLFEDNFSTDPFLVKPLFDDKTLSPSNVLKNPKFIQKLTQPKPTKETETSDHQSSLSAHFVGLHSPTNKPWSPPVVFPTELPTSKSNLPQSSMAALVSSLTKNEKSTTLGVTTLSTPRKPSFTSTIMQDVSSQKSLTSAMDLPVKQFQTTTSPFISSSPSSVTSSSISSSSSLPTSSSMSSSSSLPTTSAFPLSSTMPLSSTISLSSTMLSSSTMPSSSTIPLSSTISSSSATLEASILPSSSMQTFVVLPSSLPNQSQNFNTNSSSFQSTSTTFLASTVEPQTSRMQPTVSETTPSVQCQPSGTPSPATTVPLTTADIVVVSTRSKQNNRQRSRSTTKRPSLKSSLDACNRNCNRNNNKSICAKPTGDGEVDPESLKGFPSECHLNCYNNFKRQQYEKLIDGKCGRLRNKVRPLDADKLTRGELKRAQYQVNKEPQEIIEFTPL